MTLIFGLRGYYSNMNGNLSVNINKYTKRQLIDIILIYYLKEGKVVETNLNKLNKKKLIEIINENEISIYDNYKLMEETLEIERYTTNLEIIYYNFMKFKNIPIYIIKEIQNNPDLKAVDLEIIINANNLIIENDINEMTKFNKMIFTIAGAINEYSYNNNILEYKTLPDIINVLNYYQNYY
jgi:hypothetical protein